jgi:hypothetical protein
MVMRRSQHKTKSQIWPSHAYLHVGSNLTRWQQKQKKTKKLSCIFLNAPNFSYLVVKFDFFMGAQIRNMCIHKFVTCLSAGPSAIIISGGQLKTKPKFRFHLDKSSLLDNSF